MARPSNLSVLNISQLQQMLESRRSELSKLSKERSELQKNLDAVEAKIQRIGGSGRGGRRGNGRRPHNEQSLNDVMAAVLGESSKPMRVGEIMEAVQAQGYRSGSDNFRGIVNQSLIKDKRFVAVERGLYQLKK